MTKKDRVINRAVKLTSYRIGGCVGSQCNPQNDDACYDGDDIVILEFDDDGDFYPVNKNPNDDGPGGNLKKLRN